MRKIILLALIPFAISCGNGSSSSVPATHNPFTKKQFYKKGDYAEFDWTYGTKYKGDYTREVNQYNSTDQRYFFVEKWLSTSGEKYEGSATIWVDRSYLEWDFKETQKILDQCVSEGRVEVVEVPLGKFEACAYETSPSPRTIKWLAAVPLGAVKKRIYHDDGHIEEMVLRAAHYDQ